jgi:hypothetical protein
MRTFRCQCGAAVFFDNSRCLTCGRELGFLPEALEIVTLEPDGEVFATPHGPYAKCANYVNEGVCNWMVRGAAQAGTLCQACERNHVIPDLSQPENRKLWGEVEKAKRRLVYGIHRLGLPLASRRADPDRGLAFDIKADDATTRVLTGHDDGLITLNLAEADAPIREKMRVAMRERYRTLLGHFRHEVGHYYWDRLVRDTEAIEPFRALFGDERADYGEALKQHYAKEAPEGEPAPDAAFISHYASSHPWEDFAETFAHYLHIDDTLETARAYGVPGAGPPASSTAGTDDYATTLRQWGELTVALNALNRSMGMTDAYPFGLSPTVSKKLRFVHDLVTGARPTAGSPLAEAKARCATHSSGSSASPSPSS